MNRKYLILITVVIIGLIMVSIPYVHNHMKADSDQLGEIHSVDSDGDYLPDYLELEYGTDPFEADSDHDFIDDMDEIYLGTNPLEWDTDGDHMADGYEKGTRGDSTSPFETDSDHDGLPDPWEDNDGDLILNREEQLPMHDGVCFYVPLFAHPSILDDDATSTALDPNDADTDGDGWDDGFEIQVNSTWNHANAVSPPPPVDRKNSDTDIANANSYAYFFTTTYFGWDAATNADWRNGLKLAGQYGILPAQCTHIAWYHFSPYWLYEQLHREDPTPPNFNTWRQNFFHGTTVNPDWGVSNEDFWGDVDRGTPYDWNWYDCDPSLNDTDGDFMDDNWDSYPLRYNNRNGTFTAVTGINRVGETEITMTPPYNSPDPDQWAAFEKNITVLELEKGDWVDINITIGLVHCDPGNGTHVNWLNSYWNPISVRIQFRQADLGNDNRPHTGDDEVNDTNVAFLTRRFSNVDAQHILQSMREVSYTNQFGATVTMSFYYEWFRIRIPSRVPAGQVAIVVETITDNNFHYFPSEEWDTY
ncbi:hypothetical protein [[Eubacterium] cellulosolvens]